MSNRRKASQGFSRTVEPPPEVTAGWPMGRLVDALQRAGWGQFDGRYYGAVRSILHALATLLGPSGQGEITAGQVADASGLSLLWTRRKLAELEDAGLLVWRRGEIRDGRPAPGFIRVSKQVLADAVNHARRVGNPKALARAVATVKRIADAGLRWTKRAAGGQRRIPMQTEPVPSLQRRSVGAGSPPREPARPVTGTLLSGPRPAVGSRFAAVRALMQQQTAAAPA